MNASGPLVLVIEDEAPMRRFIRATLESHGHRVLEADRLSEGMALLTGHNPDLVLLDLGLPDGDGVTFTRRIREWSRVPVIVLSARGREEDKVNALDAGADDYLHKPFGVLELLARMRVAQRHARPAAPADEVLLLGDVRVDVARHEVTRAGEALHLTPTEFKLLLLLARNAGKVLTHRHILKEVWGPAYAGQAHLVRVHMAELRKKVEVNPSQPRLLLTETGVGYRLRDG